EVPRETSRSWDRRRALLVFRPARVGESTAPSLKHTAPAIRRKSRCEGSPRGLRGCTLRLGSLPGGDMRKPIDLTVNGKRYSISSDPEATLLQVLRDELGLTGTKYGCGEGQCGACTVLLGGTARRSCQLPVGPLTGQSITTIEGLERDGKLHPLQQAFIDVG